MAVRFIINTRKSLWSRVPLCLCWNMFQLVRRTISLSNLHYLWYISSFLWLQKRVSTSTQPSRSSVENSSRRVNQSKRGSGMPLEVCFILTCRCHFLETNSLSDPPPDVLEFGILDTASCLRSRGSVDWITLMLWFAYFTDHRGICHVGRNLNERREHV